MTAPQFGPCTSWATEADLCEPCEPYALDFDAIDDALLRASQVLFFASGQQFHGECEETIRPCVRRSFGGPFSSPVLLNGHWTIPHLMCGCAFNSNCGCGSLDSIHLPRYPITDIVEVKIDGSAISSSLYRVDEYSYLVRTDGEPWPCCQDLALPDTELDTFSVTYTWGMPVPEIGVRAAADLGCDFYAACNTSDFEGLCRLPSNLTALVRQGVSATFLAQTLFIKETGRPLRTGIPSVDLFLSTVNPHGLTAPSVVLSPDVPDAGTRVDT